MRKKLIAVAVASSVALGGVVVAAGPASAATTTPFTKQCFTHERKGPILTGDWRKTSKTITVENVILTNLTSFDFRITKMTLTDRKTGKRVNGWTGVVYQGRNSKKWSPKKTFPRGHVLDLVIKGHRMNAVGDTLNGCGLHS
jgi:hypothetical protein